MRVSARIARVWVQSTCFALAVLVAGCGESKPPTQTETPSISVTVSPTSGSVVQGASTVVNVTVTGAGGFTGTATIALQSPPAGVTGTVGNPQTNGGTTTAAVTINVAGSVAPGNYNLTIRATGTGVAAADATFALTVTAAPAYTLSATPNALMIEQDGSGSTDIGLARTNFTGDVTLAVEGAPSGMTTGFGTNPVGGALSVLTIQPDATVALGTHTLTIRGTATGLTERTVTVDVVVTAPAVPDYMLTVNPAALTINLGDSKDATVGVVRSNFNDAVTLAAEGLPTGVTVAFAGNPVAGNSTTMTVTVAGSATTGDYSFTLRGTTAALAEKTVSVDLTVQDVPAYTLALNPTSITIARSASGTVDVTLARTNFTEAVDLSLENAPAGVTGSFSIDPLSGTASVLTLDVGGSVVPGDYTLTVRGTSASLAEETAALTLTVPVPPGFTLASLAGVSIQQGSSGDRTVAINRTGGFAGDVTVTVTGLASGITASVIPVSTAGNSVVVTISADGTAALGQSTATVHGTATGLPESTQVLDIDVTQMVGQQFTFDFSVCDLADRPVWVAYRDGGGSWTVGTGSNDVYTFSVAETTVGIAMATEPVFGQSNVFVYYATRAELGGVDSDFLCDVAPTGKTATATTAGINAANFESATLTLGNSTLSNIGNGGVTFTAVPDGNLDLVGYKASPTNATDKMFFLRDQNPTNGGDIGTIDFASGFDPITAIITAPAGTTFWEMEYATSPSAGVCYYAPLQTGIFLGGSTFTARGAPAGQQQAGDVHLVTLSSGFSTVAEAFVAFANRSIVAPPTVPVPTITDITGSANYKRVRAELTLPSGYNETVSISLVDGAGDRSVVTFATAAWLGGLGVAIEIPDFTGLSGWNDAWAPAGTSAADWFFFAFGASGAECTDGYREFSTGQFGTVP